MFAEEGISRWGDRIDAFWRIARISSADREPSCGRGLIDANGPKS